MPTGSRLDPAVLKLAGILALGALTPLLDSTIVSIALHTLSRDLNTSTAAAQWVSTAYLLALAMVVPVSGWAVERFGARRVWLGSLTLFLTGSVLCGLAWNIGSLIVFRILQGVGAGPMLPMMQTLVMRAAGGRDLGRLMAVVTLPALVVPILGPVLGGLIVGHLSWRWIFYVNLPVCLLALALAVRGVPKDTRRPGHRLDLTGLLLLSPGLALLVYGLTETGAVRETAIAVGAVLTALFAVHALRTPEPLVDLRLFGDRGFAVSSSLMFLSGLALYGGMFLLPLYYQQARGQGVIAAGLLLAPQGLGSLLARVTGPLTDRVGARPVVVAGTLLTALGTLPFVLRHPMPALLPLALVIRGFGMSAANLAVMVGAYQGLDHTRVPHASTAVRIVQQLGGSFGTAVLAAVLAQGGFPRAFLWSTAFTFFASLVGLRLPTGLASAEPRT
ncbi:multidrug transporter [Streptomyces canus]|uniref:Multidrug transporter n=1 Tax=Streptomyces canus TaxID=58343 RepID=A0A101RLC9_9ACTN|nr:MULTISPECIES: MDR family MFS transporter [Streptomyces]KUN57679.1 multidrug transporter [Streptomyces canus]MDI5904790.1 MDR family MFS transporter [Streptomyces sp. 12257]